MPTDDLDIEREEWITAAFVEEKRRQVREEINDLRYVTSRQYLSGVLRASEDASDVHLMRLALDSDDYNTNEFMQKACRILAELLPDAHPLLKDIADRPPFAAASTTPETRNHRDR
jgi:hypothetical protein